MGSIRFQRVERDGNPVIEEIHKLVFHSFLVGDAEDPDLYASQPLWEWEQSPQGQFIMEHAIDKPEWHRSIDNMHYGYRYTIIAELEKKKLTEFYLKWGKLGWK